MRFPRFSLHLALWVWAVALVPARAEVPAPEEIKTRLTWEGGKTVLRYEAVPGWLYLFETRDRNGDWRLDRFPAQVATGSIGRLDVTSYTDVPQRGLRVRAFQPLPETGAPPQLVATRAMRLPPPYRAGEAQGTVKVRYFVDAGGNVVRWRVLESDATQLRGAVIASLREWKFLPTTVGGQPTRSVVEQRFVFGE